MPRTIHKTEQPVVLEGYQAVLKPSKFGYSLSAIVDSEIVDALETDREESLQWAQGKLKNPKRSVLKPEPWEEVAEGQFKVKFSWNEENRPPVVDTEGTPVEDENTPMYSGSRVKLAFYQKPYILKDGVTYGTSLKLEASKLTILLSLLSLVPMMTSDFQFTVAKDEVTGIYKGTLDIQLPPICVTRYKADKNDFKYEMSRAVTEVVEAIIEKNMDD
jgi:hypothetical protein